MTDTWKTFQDVVYRSGAYYIKNGSSKTYKATVVDDGEFWIIKRPNGTQDKIDKHFFPSPIEYLQNTSPDTWRWTR